MSLFIVLILFTQSANAALGDKADGIGSEQAKLRAESHQIDRQRSDYTVHELAGPIYTVREYVAKDGTVFAVTWSGVKRPDMSVLLGQHFSEYQAIDSARPRMKSRGPVVIKTSKAVVRKFGHMRDIRGIAYLQDGIPANLTPKDLK